MTGTRPSFPNRRQFLASASLALGAPAFSRNTPQRVVVIMCDGFGLDYFDPAAMPVLGRWKQSGIFRPVQDAMPSVTNTNNASICCGVWADQHGITGNSYLDEKTGREEYMERADLLLAPTLFQRAQKYGVKSALLSSKKKTIQLLPAGADLVLSAEVPTPEWVQRLGPAPDIYSREINHWLLQAAIDILKNRRDITCLYVHTTDYPMHMWPPSAPESKEHLSRLDQLFGEAAAAAPDAAFLLSADHGMNFKSHCWDLGKALEKRGAPVRIAISVERDKYPKHHRGHGGVSWLYCRNRREIDHVAKTVSTLTGVETVLTRSEAARRFHLLPSRIGDLIVLASKETVFGDLETESEALPPEYRSHGSLYERDIPLFVYNTEAKLSPNDFRYNRDLARWLYPQRASPL
jgi:phosphonoacetate hydrolase